MNKNLSVLGINFRTAPVELRERASYAQGNIPEIIGRIGEKFPGAEVVLLSTCNRTELYATGIAMDTGKPVLVNILLKGTSKDGSSADEKHFYAKEGLAAAEHLLAVAAGLDSMVVGETEILGQVKQAYMLAQQAESSGKTLDPLFQTSFRIAKRVHSETDICRGRVSVSSIAVEFAEKMFENLGTKTVMIVGAGETAELALKSLIERGAKDVLVLNRSIERATTLAERHGGRAIQFDLLDDYLPRADIVISSTSAPHCVIREAAVRKAVAVRRGSPILLIDIAVPRDIETAVGELENVYLYDIDDLQRVADENLAKRREAVDGAWKIVKEGSDEIASIFDGADLREMMRRLDDLGREAAESVLQKALAREKMTALPEETREGIRLVAEKVVGKLLMGPRDALKRAAKNGQWADYSRVVNDLFRFDDKRDADRGKEEQEKGKS